MSAGLPDEFYREIAEKVRGKRNFRAMLAAEYGVTEATAASWARKARQRGFLEPRPKGTNDCAVDGCERNSEGRKWCGPHRRRARLYGDPLGTVRKPTEVRFWEKVNKDGPIPKDTPQLGSCWIWTSVLNSTGYGRFMVTRTPHVVALAHRYAYELCVGKIPEGLTLDHLCFTRRCINPDHLEPVTQAENNRRARVRRFARKGREAA